MKKLFLFFFLLFFSACSYKPISHFTKDSFGENIFVETKISLQDPKNTVLINDALKEAVIKRFDDKLTSRNKADTIIIATLQKVNFKPMIYDNFGYIVAYKAYVKIKFDTITTKDGKKSEVVTSGDYNFKIESNSVISDSKRFEAIRSSAIMAIDEYIALSAMKGIKNGKHNK